ncbi:hypothetical protein ACH5RR_010801 [Cinchona calisaya]|uniref:Uncharacterized protein n=1 Tax=Cinchona calisaya TaxID=153742 RepID=A0ABD3AJY1_9GENT
MSRSNFIVELDADASWLSTKTGELLLLTLVYDGRVSRLLGVHLFLGCMQKAFSFAVRDSPINIGPVCCSGHGKNGAVCVLQKSILPENCSEVGASKVKSFSTYFGSHNCWELIADGSLLHNYYVLVTVVLSFLVAKGLVIQVYVYGARRLDGGFMSGNNLEEVTENIDYYIQRSAIAAGKTCLEVLGGVQGGYQVAVLASPVSECIAALPITNLRMFHCILIFSEMLWRLVIQVYAYGARLLDGGFMVQELSFEAPNSEIGSGSESQKVSSSVSIADPCV